MVAFLLCTLLVCSCSKQESGPILAEKEEKKPVANSRFGPDYPYDQHFDFGTFPENLEWVNTDGPVRAEDLRGKFVLVDFWTSCCLNCFHVLAELEKVKEKYPNEVVVVGIHSGKFSNEKDSQNVLEAIEKYRINHPVANDFDHKYFQKMAAMFWPTVIVVTPDGQMVLIARNEIKAEYLVDKIEQGLDYYRKKDLIDDSPLHLKVARSSDAVTPLRFPGNVLADDQNDRLYIADSGHNRIVICTLDGKLLDVVGTGKVGRSDGGFENATFNYPQGMALRRNTLYVADSKNHCIRAIDLVDENVSTVAGVGEISEMPFPKQDGFRKWSGDPLKTKLKSPWSLLVHSDWLYIGMAGSHQIWRMALDGSKIELFAGNGREDVVDGPYLPSEPYKIGSASFGQPMGITRSLETMYVADAEGNSIRQVPLIPNGTVTTLLGTDYLPQGRLFSYGDVNGPYKTAKFQHPMDVEFHIDRIFVADTYNNKIKSIQGSVDLIARDNAFLEDFIGTGQAGLSNDPNEVMFDEPGGLSASASKLYVADTNNHVVRVVGIYNKETSTIKIEGLEPPVSNRNTRPDLSWAHQIETKPVAVTKDKQLSLDAELFIAEYLKLNDQAANGYYVDFLDTDKKPIEMNDFQPIDPTKSDFKINVDAIPGGTKYIRISMIYYYCTKGGEGICRLGGVAWTVPVISDDTQSGTDAIQLQHTVE